jgi:hypothetical protein
MEHRYDGKASVSGALHKMKKEVTKAGKMVCVRPPPHRPFPFESSPTNLLFRIIRHRLE